MSQRKMKDKIERLRFYLGNSTSHCTTMIDILDDMEIEKSKKLDNQRELNYLKNWHLSNVNLG
jgi:hypothetical protein